MAYFGALKVLLLCGFPFLLYDFPHDVNLLTPICDDECLYGNLKSFGTIFGTEFRNTFGPERWKWPT